MFLEMLREYWCYSAISALGYLGTQVQLYQTLADVSNGTPLMGTIVATIPSLEGRTATIPWLQARPCTSPAANRN
jgi:hypothetical protein